MSWKASGWAKEVRGISRSEKLLLMILADYYDEERGYAWPTVSRLASEACLSYRQSIRLLKKLQERGIIAIEQAAGRPGRANRYRLNRESDMMSRRTSDVTLNVTSDVTLTDKEPSPEEDLPKNSRAQHEALLTQLKTASAISTPDRYWQSFEGEVEVTDLESLQNVVSFVDRIRGEVRRDREPLRLPVIVSGLEKVGRWIEDVRPSREAALDVLREMFSTHGTPPGRAMENTLLLIGRYPDEFIQRSREIAA